MGYKIQIEVPESVFSITKQKPDEFAGELLHAAIVKWYEQGRISQSKAAEIYNISRSSFLELLKEYQVTPYQVNEEDLQNEYDLK